MKFVLSTFIAVCLLIVSEACISDHDCSTSRCSDGYHQHCNTQTETCYCNPAVVCSFDGECPTGHMSGCEPFGARCEHHKCRCHHI